MKGINTPGQALNPRHFVPQGAGYLNLAIPALARKWNQQVGSAPLASFGNEEIIEMLRNLPKEALDSILSQLNKNRNQLKRMI